MLEDALAKGLAAAVLIAIVHVVRTLVSKAKSANKNDTDQDTEK